MSFLLGRQQRLQILVSLLTDDMMIPQHDDAAFLFAMQPVV
jgi:hypothetical protein